MPTYLGLEAKKGQTSLVYGWETTRTYTHLRGLNCEVEKATLDTGKHFHVAPITIIYCRSVRKGTIN